MIVTASFQRTTNRAAASTILAGSHGQRLPDRGLFPCPEPQRQPHVINLSLTSPHTHLVEREIIVARLPPNTSRIPFQEPAVSRALIAGIPCASVSAPAMPPGVRSPHLSSHAQVGSPRYPGLGTLLCRLRRRAPAALESPRSFFG